MLSELLQTDCSHGIDGIIKKCLQNHQCLLLWFLDGKRPLEKAGTDGKIGGAVHGADSDVSWIKNFGE